MTRLLCRLRRAQDGLALTEFALALPLFLGFLLSGIEMSNYVIANNRVQRLATMMGDLVGQSGSGVVGDSEAQVYDLFTAMEITAYPFDLKQHGRVVVTAVKGTDNDNNGIIENRIMWQRFDGGAVGAEPSLGCHETQNFATLPDDRQLSLDELLFHVEVTYQYQPVFSAIPFSMLDLPTSFRRQSMFRARSNQFQRPALDPDYPAKSHCDTADGL